MKKLSTTRLADPTLEAVRQEHAAAIGELQGLACVGFKVVQNVALADGVATPISHGLDRLPAWVSASCPRGPSSTGRIEEVRDGGHDRKRYVVLKASGWGATVTVDVAVLQMNAAENIDGQAPGYVSRRFQPCKCDPVKGDYAMRACHCSTDEDGTRSHGGTTSENGEHKSSGFPGRV